MTALSHAEGRIARCLIEHGADIRAVDGRRATALHHAARGGLFGGCRYLLGAGLKAEAQDVDDQTPGHIAARWGYPGIEQLLIGQGASVMARTKDGMTVADLRDRGAGLRHMTEEHALFALLPDQITLVDAVAYSQIHDELGPAEGMEETERVTSLRRKSLRLLEDFVHQYRNDPHRATGKGSIAVVDFIAESVRMHPPEDPSW